MKLSTEVCISAARDAGQGSLWAAIGTDASVNAQGNVVHVALKDGRSFRVEREGHKDYKLHGHIKPYADDCLCELGKKFIQVDRKSGRETAKALEASSKSAHKEAKHIRKKYL